MMMGIASLLSRTDCTAGMVRTPEGGVAELCLEGVGWVPVDVIHEAAAMAKAGIPEKPGIVFEVPIETEVMDFYADMALSFYADSRPPEREKKWNLMIQGPSGDCEVWLHAKEGGYRLEVPECLEFIAP